MNVNLTLTVEEVNYILNCLGSRPFAEVQALINKIKADGDAQLASAAQVNAAPAADATATPDAPQE